MEILENINQTEQNIETGEDYENLRREIKEIKKLELKNKLEGETYNPHFDNINSAELIDKDLEIYRKFKEKTLTLQEILEYQKSFAKAVNLENDPRGNFMAWLVNQTSAPEWIKRWKQEWQKK